MISYFVLIAVIMISQPAQRVNAAKSHRVSSLIPNP
jgi:hypothetical protein